MPLTPFEIGTQIGGLTVAGLSLYYLKHLETIGCKCSMNYKRTYIMFYHIFGLVFGSAQLLSGGKLAEYIVESRYAIPFVSILAVAAITNIVFTLMYIEELKKDNCECSESVFRTMMYILSIIGAVTWGLALLLGLIFGGLIMSMPKIKVPTLQNSKGKK
jgi:hypothetical protein